MAQGVKRAFNIVLAAILVFAMTMGFTVIKPVTARAANVATQYATIGGAQANIPLITFEGKVTWCYDQNKTVPNQTSSVDYTQASPDSLPELVKKILWVGYGDTSSSIADTLYQALTSAGASTGNKDTDLQIVTQLAIWAAAQKSDTLQWDTVVSAVVNAAIPDQLQGKRQNYISAVNTLLGAANSDSMVVDDSFIVNVYEPTSAEYQRLVNYTKSAPSPVIRTKAWGDKNGGSSKEVEAKAGVVVYDDVTIENLGNGTSYTLISNLFLLDSSGQPAGSTPLMSNSQSFTAEGGSVERSVQFEPVDLSNYGDGSYKLVVTCSLAVTDGEPVATHEDFNNIDQTVKIKAEETPAPDPFSITVTKKWVEADGTTDATPPDGGYVKVQLAVSEDPIGEAITLDASNDWTHTWVGLEKHRAGDYTITETEFKGEGFTQGTVVKGTATDDNQPFTITNKKTETPTPEPSPSPDPDPSPNPSPSPDPTPTPTPDPDTRTVSFSKTDLDGKALAGATLQVLDKDGKVVEEWKSEADPHSTTLAFGTYKLHELYAPDGYFVAGDVEFTVAEDQAADATKVVTMKDKPYPTITISKVDESTGKELAGASLEVRNAEKKVVDSWTSTAEAHAVKLAPGKYTLTETKAPSGYAVAADVAFEVNENGLTSGDKVVMKDKKAAAAASGKGANKLAKTGDEAPVALAVTLAGIAAASIGIALRRRQAR